MALFSTEVTVYDLIKQDHKEAQQLMEAINDAESSEERGHLFAELKAALTAHAEAEEEVFYSRLREEGATRDLVLEADQEHRLAKQLLNELEKSEVDDEWMSKFLVLKHNVEHHVQEEEKMLLPRARQVLPKDEAVDMADEFEDAKEERIPVLA